MDINHKTGSGDFQVHMFSAISDLGILLGSGDGGNAKKVNFLQGCDGETEQKSGGEMGVESSAK